MTEEKVKATMIPANPGFDLVCLAHANGEPVGPFIYTPIIAWAIEDQYGDRGEYESAMVRPICVDWNCNQQHCPLS